MAADLAASRRLEAFLCWLQEYNIWVNQEAIQIRLCRAQDKDLADTDTDTTQAHYAVFAEKNLVAMPRGREEGQGQGQGQGQEVCVCRIPKTSCLTILTCSIADELLETDIRGPLALIMTVMYEMVNSQEEEREKNAQQH